MTTFINATKGVIRKAPESFIPIGIDKVRRVVKEKKVCGHIELLKTIEGVNLLFKQFIKSKSNEISYFQPFIEKMSILKGRGLIEIKEYEKVVSYLDDNYKLLYLRIMYESKCFNSNFMKQYVDLAININSKHNNTRFWMIQDMSEMVFRFPEYLYNDYYRDRKKAILKYKETLNIKSWTPDKKRNVCEKYAIITNGLTSQSNAVSYLVYKYANELVKQGKQVAIFPNDSLLYYRNECIVRPIKSAISCSPIMYYDHKKILNEQIKISYSRGISTKGRIINCLNNIKNYSPDVIIDTAGQCSFFTVFVKGIYPIIHLTFNGYIVGAFFDKYISKYKKYTFELNEIYRVIYPEKIEEILIGFEYKQPKKKFKRETYGLLSDDFVYITVGNRLDVELKIDFISVICNHLRNTYHTKWIVVGKIDIKLFSDFQELIESNRIILISYEKDLTGLYKLCDAYIEPDRTGGGTSIFWAMYQGLPIVISDFRSDIIPTVGIENSVKGGYSNFDGYMKKLENDEEFYQKNSILMKERAYKSNIKQYISSLIKVADKLVLMRE